MPYLSRMDFGDIALLSLIVVLFFGISTVLLKYLINSFINGITGSIDNLAGQVSSLDRKFDKIKDSTFSLDKNIAIITEKMTNYDDKLSVHKELIDDSRKEIHKINTKIYKIDIDMVTQDQLKKYTKER